MMKQCLLLFTPVYFDLMVVVSPMELCGCVLETPPCSWSSWTQWTNCKDRCADHHIIRTRQPCCQASKRNGSCLDQCLKICNESVASSFEISKLEHINKTQGKTTRGRWYNFARRGDNIFDGMGLEGPQFVLDGKLILTSSTPVPQTTTSLVNLPDPSARESQLSDIHSLAITGVALISFICLAVCCCLMYFIISKNKKRKQRRRQVQITTNNGDNTATEMRESSTVDF